MSAWQPIETAPKGMDWKNGIHEYGKHILAYPVRGGVSRVRWWQAESGACNFIDDGGTAALPTHWMPLPEPPK